VEAGYVYDQAWAQERERLQGIEGLYDEISKDRLRAVGVGPGWKCLEVGCGAGSIARWLAETVGPDGHVVASDLDPRFVTDGPSLEVRRHDVLADELEEGSFDLIHSRMVLEHIPERERALERLAAALRPGGWLVIEDVDFGGPMVEALARYASDPSVRGIYERVLSAFERFMGAAGMDPGFGPRLVSSFERLGLIDVDADSRARLVRGGANDFGRLSLAAIGPAMVEAGLLTAEELGSVAMMLEQPARSTMSMFLVGARGRRSADV
jgi:SAM-dependent methyltransferase